MTLRTRKREVGKGREERPNLTEALKPFVAFFTVFALFASFAVSLGGCAHALRGELPIRVWGEPGPHDGEFNQPRSVDFLPDGSVVVLDRSDRIQLFTPEGRWLRTWHVPTVARGNPRGLDIGPDGLIYVADTHNSRILVYDATGHLRRRWGRYGKAPGEFIWVTDVAVDHAGNVYTCEYGESGDRLQKFDARGHFMLQWGTLGEKRGQFQRPQGIAVDAAGNVYVADAANHRIQKLSPRGAVLGAWGGLGTEEGRLRYPYDVALDALGRVYVVEYGNMRVSVFDAEGRFLRGWGGPGRVPGRFDHPWGIGVDASGAIYVADTRSARIQVFAPLPPQTPDAQRLTPDRRRRAARTPTGEPRSVSGVRRQALGV
jgi:DNA-binding beta-propeller fold protein YncE